MFALQFRPVQTFVAKKAADYLSKELNTTISLSGIYIKPFKSVVIENLLVLDQQKDTLLSTPKFLVNMDQLSLDKRIIAVNTVQINNGSFFLKSYKDTTSNLDFIIDYFDSGPPTVKKKKKPYQISFARVILNNINFKYKNYRRDTVMKGVNFDDVALSNLNGIFEKLNTKDHILQTDIKNLTFREKSGFYLKNLSAFTTVDTNSIELKKLLLVTNRSRLSDYFQMRFKKFSDFDDYFNKIRMKADFKDSHVSSHDVSYFTSDLDMMNLDIDIDGQITGLVKDLRSKSLSIKAGKATYVKGDFAVKGLPELSQTFMDFKVEMAGTNKTDLDELVRNISGKKGKIVPDILGKFGNINFNGSFTGFPNDFIAFGEFKTKLGRVVSDVNMKIDKKNVPSYTGNVKTYDFDIGNLINEKTLGRLSASLYIKGRGTEVKNLSEKLNGDVDYIDFNNYRYRNVKVDGTFEKKYFDGRLTIDDKNVQLAFDGGVNLNPELPEFNFKATIKNAKLRALKLYKDSLKLDAVFSTNFSGNDLNNIQGNLLLQHIVLNNVKGIYHVDSVLLKAHGLGKERMLTVNSDILDASIKGQYDLNTIPSYYKALAKRYIPSLKAEIIKYGNQVFQFDLNIKRFEPIAELLVPGLEIEDQAIFIGNFDSPNNTATLNGYIKKLKYKGVIVNNIIVDENTSPNQLQAIITSDRVDLNDSLYIKNVNISNILRNDSLSLNIKMADSDDENQLDLNGLIEFGGDTTARISILPSLLTINKEDWKIQEKVKINFQDGKTEISNFDLNNGRQLLTLDGTLSNDPKDALILGFKDFSLRTLNPFVKTLGITLSGNLNGETRLSNILKSPRINDNIKIDSLTFNDTHIGDLRDTSGYDQTNKMVNIFTNVMTNGKETLKATGGLDLDKKQVDIALKLDKSELAVLGPFVSNLVSNLKGRVSSNLTIKGPFDKPSIDGDITLDEATMTINYLKTTYTISDQVDVANSTIQINDLRLVDVNKNEAIANGTVDLNDLNNPGLDIVIDAKEFMALNTTEKDNGLYFGQAFATGTFKFKGPTNQLFIDIDAKTEKGTVFNLPLNNSETVSSKDFITFVGKDTTATQALKKTSFDGLTMSLKLSVDQNSTANIFTSLGNLSGKGNSKNLALKINTFGDFEMSGDYIIETGNFDFTAQEVINKKFNIRQGGTIRWTGNPTTAQINLKAIYSVRASTADLLTAANLAPSNSTSGAERVLTEVEMGLTGLLLKPDIKLDIFFPSNPAIKEQLQTYFNDDNNRNLQALSLIIRRSFAPGNGKEDLGKQLQSGVASTATELLFNQLNNVLSSLNLDFVDLNLRSLNDANASFRFFKDRVILNAGIVDRNSTNDLSLISSSNVGGEVEVLGLIKKDGTLVGKLANKPPTQQSSFILGTAQSTNVTSFGLIYTQQFDSFREFLQKMTGKYRREERKKQLEREKLEEEKRKAEEKKKSPALKTSANQEAVSDKKKNKKK